LLVLSQLANAADAIGGVDRVKGVATGTVDGVELQLAPADPVYSRERIVTGDAARLAIGFMDSTKLTVGENADVTLDDFVYQPGGQSAMRISLVGAFRFISGPTTPAATLTTPFAVIGVRGTDFWGGPIDGVFGVVLFEGSVTVTSNGVQVILDQPGEGVDINPVAAVPGPVVNWAQAKIDRAVATVTFP
jgi:hypothetical protein